MLASEPITSVSQFVEDVMNWEREGQTPVAFRGQSFDGWKTMPKILRRDVGLYPHEKNAVRDLVSIHPQEFRDDNTMFDRLVRMQHFELPTRLLDVTTNPLVALYFATSDYSEFGEEKNGKVQAVFIPEGRQRYYDSDRVSCMSNMANLSDDEKSSIIGSIKLKSEDFNKLEAVKKLIWFVRTEKPHFEPRIEPADISLPVYVKPKMSNRRIIAQSGAFIIFGAHRTSQFRFEQDLRLQKIIIRAEYKSKIRKQLERLGIHASSLFPEIDKAADFIVKRYSTSS